MTTALKRDSVAAFTSFSGRAGLIVGVAHAKGSLEPRAGRPRTRLLSGAGVSSIHNASGGGYEDPSRRAGGLGHSLGACLDVIGHRRAAKAKPAAHGLRLDRSRRRHRSDV